MKTSHIFGITLIFIMLVLALVAASSFDHPTTSAQTLGAAALHRQVATPTPTAQDQSEVGSTDGIVIMGFVLTATLIVPFLILRKRR
jgi:hypothetical protein